VTAAALPRGYVELSEGGTEGVLLAALEAPLRAALGSGTFYDYAARHPEARSLAGRGVAYAVPLPGNVALVVVRRSRHGGLLAPLTGDRFFGRTRAPHELAMSAALVGLGVPTPEFVGYATYPAGPFRRRADVLTREIPYSRDLAAALASPEAGLRRQAIGAAARLLASLAAASVQHPDLNLKNILLVPAPGGDLTAMVIDVDRVRLTSRHAAAAANLRRLLRSGRKWRARTGLRFDESAERALRDASALV
jgi:Lipopolysaccharide kinase (Kdo/WaaP) family